MWRLVWLALAVAVTGDEEGGSCERIRLPLCQDLGYNWTAMPNLLGHSTQDEAALAMESFAEMLSSGCSVHARFLVCSAFAPLCSAEVAGAVSACRALCDAVQRDCAAHLPPRALPCRALSHDADRRLCMRPPNGTEPAPALHAAPRPAPPAPQPAPPRCGSRRPEQRAASLWLGALAWLSLLCTAGALLTYCAEPARYRYPERPCVWMATCHAVVALAHVVRAWLGADALTCADGALAVDGLASPPCVAFFVVTYYFSVAADAWFAGAGVAWYLTAAAEWSTEALERAAVYVHAAAWGWAALWTAAAVALRQVAADELWGVCGVREEAAGALVGAARGAALAAACVAAAGAVPGLRRVRRALGVSGARRVGRVAARAGAAGLLYAAAAGGGVAARVCGGAWWPAAWLCGGVAASSWSWSRKSAAVWRRALCPPHKAPCCPPPPPPPLLRAPPPGYKRPPVSRV